MSRKTFSHGFTLGALALLIMSMPNLMNAQGATSTQENVLIRPGIIFEIYADTIAPDAQVTWVLNKGDTFMQANRGSIFSIRPTEVADYYLNGEVSDGQGTPARNTFKIQAKQDAPLVSQSGTGNDSKLVHSFPVQDADGIVLLPGEKRLLRLDIVHSEIEQLALDVNTEIDNNGDGDAFNDNILDGSIFAMGRGSLYIWFKPTMQTQTLLVAARLKNGALATQQLHIRTTSYEEVLRQQAELEAQQRRARTQIVDNKIGERTYDFAVQAESGVIIVPALYYWNFGDGTQSLLDMPKHQFSEAKTYEMKVSVRDARTGEVIINVNRAFDVVDVIDPNATPPPASDDPQDDDKPDTTKKKDSNAGSLMATVIKALVVLAISIGFGMLVVFLISKLKGTSLQKSLEKAEEKLVGDKTLGDSSSATPMKLEKEGEEKEKEPEKEKSEEIAKKEDKKPKAEVKEEPKEEKEPPPETPEVNRQVPSWLAPSPQTDMETPPPPPPPTSTQEPAKQDQVAEPTTPSPADAATPSWLQGNAADTPAPQEPKEETPPPPPATEPPPAPETNSNTPPWLSGANEPTTPPTAETTPPVEEPTPVEESPKIEEPTPAEQPSDATTPPWLQQESAAPVEETPPPSPEPAPPTVTEEPKEEEVQDATPPWLQATPSPESTEPSTEETPPPPISEKTIAPEPEAPKPTPPTKTPDNGDMSKEDRERERKRRKRQRYRENKRKRDQEEKANTPQEEAPKEKASTPQEEGAAPAWLQDAGTETPPPAKEPEQEGDEEVKFVISADSLEEQTPPADEGHMPPEGDIPLEEKKGE